MTITQTVLFLDDFEIFVDIGIHAFEKGAPQKLAVSVRLTLAPSFDFEADSIADTVDYDFIRLEIQKICAAERYNTQEKLCFDILKIVSAKKGIVTATVTTKKLEIYADAAAVGCEMTAVFDEEGKI